MNTRLYCLEWPGNAPTESWIRCSTLGATARGLPASVPLPFPIRGSIFYVRVCRRAGDTTCSLLLVSSAHSGFAFSVHWSKGEGDTSFPLSLSSVLPPARASLQPSQPACPLGFLLVLPPFCTQTSGAPERDEGQDECVRVTSHRCVAATANGASRLWSEASARIPGNYHVTPHLGVEKVLLFQPETLLLRSWPRRLQTAATVRSNSVTRVLATLFFLPSSGIVPFPQTHSQDARRDVKLPYGHFSK